MAKSITQVYHEKFLALFARVDAQQPEKGIEALFARAQQKATSTCISLEAALESEYQAALARTEARLKLLGACKLPESE